MTPGGRDGRSGAARSSTVPRGEGQRNGLSLKHGPRNDPQGAPERGGPPPRPSPGGNGQRNGLSLKPMDPGCLRSGGPQSETAAPRSVHRFPAERRTSTRPGRAFGGRSAHRPASLSSAGAPPCRADTGPWASARGPPLRADPIRARPRRPVSPGRPPRSRSGGRGEQARASLPSSSPRRRRNAVSHKLPVPSGPHSKARPPRPPRGTPRISGTPRGYLVGPASNIRLSQRLMMRV